MTQTDEIIEQIRNDESAITSFMLRDLIKDHQARRGETARALAKRYKQQGLPIQTRRSPNPNKVDERVPNDFYADIVDTKTGYMGNEVSVELRKEAYESDAGYDADYEVIADFQTRNYAVDQNSEAVKVAARDGRVYRLLYVPSGRTEIRMRTVPEWEGIMIRDESLGEAMYFIRYWKIKDKTPGEETERTVVEWYDSTMITYYISTKDGRFVLDTNKGQGGQQPHLFNGVPVVDFKNNEETQAEPEKAIALIDAYDTVLSATVSEIEQLRLAYLAYRGGEAVDNELMYVLQQTGILPLGPDGDAKFITKDLAIDGVKVICDEIRQNIYQFSRSIDLSKDMGGDLRVIGWQVALLNLENSCKVTERKFEMALREQYRLITDLWREWNVADINPLDLKFTFTRNFPKDLASEAKTLLDLLGSVSRRTAYAQMSFIEDVDEEIEAFEAERENSIDLFGVGSADTQPDDEPDEDE